MASIFTAEDIRVSYSKIEAVHGVSIKVEEGTIVSIIGANGAGKSTVLKAISGLVPYTGKMTYMGEELPRKAHKIVESGIIYVPEGRKIFYGMSVEDNLRIGAYALKDRSKIDSLVKEQYDLFPVLYDRRNQNAGTLSGGEQQMLAVGRGLMGCPKMMLFDEPSLGLAPQVINTIFSIIEDIKKRGISVLLVEQNAKRALAICDYAYVMEGGLITLEGTGEDLIHDDKVAKAYLGMD